MAETLNTYELRSQRKKLLGELGEVPDKNSEKNKKEKLKATAESLGRDLLIGVLGGGVAGAVLGRYSFFVGLGIAGLGHYSESKAMTALGLGMMATGTFNALTGKEQDPKKSMTERITERVEAFKTDFKRKLWVDKLYADKTKIKQNDTDKTTDGLNGTKSGKKETGKNNQPVSDDGIELSAEDRAILEPEIENMINARVAEFIKAKKSGQNATQKPKQNTKEKPVKEKETPTKQNGKPKPSATTNEADSEEDFSEVKNSKDKQGSKKENSSYDDALSELEGINRIM